MQIFKVFSLLSFLFLGLSCNTTKKSLDQSACSLVGTVKNLQGLDGCDLIINTQDGRGFIPTSNTFDGVTLKDSQKIQFGYKLREDMMGNCMAGEIIELTCLQVMNEIPNTKECFDVDDPKKASWIKEAIVKYQTAEIIKYPYRTDGWAYLLLGKTSYLYDCQGTLLCERPGSQGKECLQFSDIKENSGKTIWRSEFRND